MFSSKKSIKNVDSKSVERLDTFIGRLTNSKGDITTQGSIRIDGQVEGNITATETVISGTESYIKGNITCNEALISGRVEGNITVNHNVELYSGAYVLGDITCGNLIIGKDCFFEGKCHMHGKEISK